MPFNETDAYVHAKDGCTVPDGEPCIYCEAEAEAERLESEIAKDEANWLRAFGLTNPVDAFTMETR
jgi:hypothetical protein